MNPVTLCSLVPSPVASHLLSFGTTLLNDATVADIRIGLGYILVELSDGRIGLAWSPNSRSSSCTHLPQAGKLLGVDALELLAWVTGGGDLQRAVGLATFNALNQRMALATPGEEADAIDLLEISADDKVVMIGHFAPLLGKIRQSGCRLLIVELEHGIPGTIDRQQGFDALAECDVAIITSTSIINNSLDSLLAAVGNCRAAVMLGPSTPLSPQAFAGTKITQLSGACLLPQARLAKEVVSQGGGTMILRPLLRFVSMACERGQPRVGSQ
jgi:uncharacterized protein